MLFTITTTGEGASDLGYLLHKHPDKTQRFTLSHGVATVFYPEVTDARCTVALVVELDPIGLVRGKSRSEGDAAGPLEAYVNDRTYTASSFLSVAIGEVFGSALAGRCAPRPELVDRVWKLSATVSAMPLRGGLSAAHALFTPLGYEVAGKTALLDERFPEWGESPYATLHLRGAVRIADLLSHLSVLVPVLDGEKHYWVGDDEVDKLLRRGEGWLPTHPERERIASRYLKNQRKLARAAIARLTPDSADVDADQEKNDAAEHVVERPLRLAERRIEAVLEVVRAAGVRSLVDLGCGDGPFVRAALLERSIERVIGVEVSARTLELAEARLDALNLGEDARARVSLLLGSMLYRDARLDGIDAAICIEVIEHLDPDRLPFFEANVFGSLRPRVIAVTTPNVEANAKMPGLAPGARRHRDHRFEWTRAELAAWAERVSHEHGYDVRFVPIGDDDPEVGAPTQMAIFERRAPRQMDAPS